VIAAWRSAVIADGHAPNTSGKTAGSSHPRWRRHREQITVGGKLSATVTAAVQVWLLPWMSVTVNVTGVRADIAAIKVGFAQAHAGDTAGVAAAVVDLGRSDSGLTRHIELNRQDLAQGNRRHRIDHRHRSGAGGAVAVGVSHCQSDGVRPDVAAVKAGFVQAEAGAAQPSLLPLSHVGRDDRCRGPLH